MIVRKSNKDIWGLQDFCNLGEDTVYSYPLSYKLQYGTESERRKYHTSENDHSRIGLTLIYDGQSLSVGLKGFSLSEKQTDCMQFKATWFQRGLFGV